MKPHGHFRVVRCPKDLLWHYLVGGFAPRSPTYCSWWGFDVRETVHAFDNARRRGQRGVTCLPCAALVGTF